MAEQHTASFATQDWAEQIAKNPEACIDCVVYSTPGTVPKIAQQRYSKHRVKVRFDDMIALVGAARAGLGVCRMPMFLGRSHDDLVQVPVLPPQPFIDIWLVSHRDVWRTARAKAFRDCLMLVFRANKVLFSA